MFSIVIIHYATPEPLRKTLESFSESDLPFDWEIVVVDNASPGSEVQELQKQYGWAQWRINEANKGFGWAANRGEEMARGKEMLFLNGDCIFRSEDLQAAMEVVRKLPDAGIAGFRQVTPDGWPQLTFGKFPTFFSELRRHRLQKALDIGRKLWARDAVLSRGEEPFEIDWVSGSCFWIKRRVFERVGGFDEGYFLYYEDIDLCLAVRKAGLKVYHCPRPQVVHLHGGSAATRSDLARKAYRESQLRYVRKHKGALAVLLTRVYQWGRSALG